MNVSSDTLAFPHNHQPHRRVLSNKHSSMFISPSPIAVNNKIRAIQTRKPRIKLQSYYDFTDIRPLNISNNGGTINSAAATFSNLSPEKLVERSKELRLGRLATRLNLHPSLLSTTATINQQSSVWPSQNSSRISATALGPIMNQSSTGHMPEIPQRSSRVPTTTTRHPLTEQQNLLIPIDSRRKSLHKTKSSIPKAYNQTLAKMKSSFPSSNTHISHPDYSKQLPHQNIPHVGQNETDEENVPLVVDEEFDEYLQKAIVKCADWLIKYVFDQKYDENNE